MNTNHIETMNNFSLKNMPDLDIAVLAALELFATQPLPQLSLKEYTRPLVVGSGNAEATGRIVFEDSDAVFASESNFTEKLAVIPAIDSVILVSASGAKHAPIIAKAARAAGKHVTLITNTPSSPASKLLDKEQGHELVFPKNREPYTYNTSTYMGMILGKTCEDPVAIYHFIEQTIDSLAWPDFSRYDKYYLIVPPQFSNIIRMLQVKFIELFGRNIARDVETSEYVRHATTVASSNELFISFGQANTTWGKPENRFNVPLPQGANYGAMMAVGYYVIAHIQKAYPHFFKDNIASWTAEISDIFGETVAPIVEN
jgi:hypothetical protein